MGGIHSSVAGHLGTVLFRISPNVVALVVQGAPQGGETFRQGKSKSAGFAMVLLPRTVSGRIPDRRHAPL
jgi:hypothetical protein